MEAATSATVTGAGKVFLDPSGRVITGIRRPDSDRLDDPLGLLALRHARDVLDDEPFGIVRRFDGAGRLVRGEDYVVELKQRVVHPDRLVLDDVQARGEDLLVLERADER